MSPALHIRWPKYWNFSFSISHSNEYSGLIFIRIDLFDLLTVQGTLKSLLQHHSLKPSVLQHSAFFKAILFYPISGICSSIGAQRGRAFSNAWVHESEGLVTNLSSTFQPLLAVGQLLFKGQRKSCDQDRGKR